MLRFDMYSEILAEDANNLRKEVGLPPISNWYKWQSSPRSNIAFWPEWFTEPDEDWESEIRMVGFPLPEAEDAPIPLEFNEFVDDREKPILITGGTSKMIWPEFYSLSAEACGLLGKKGILVTRHEELVPLKLSDGVKWFGYLPLNSIMNKMEAIIHHGGMGTLSGAIAAGTPQLVLAHLNDGPYNAFKLEELGVAEYIPPKKWSAEALAQALLRITEPSNRKVCMDLSQRMLNNNALEEACILIEEAVANKEFVITPV